MIYAQRRWRGGNISCLPHIPSFHLAYILHSLCARPTPERRHGHPREVAQSNPERRHGHPRVVAQSNPERRHGHPREVTQSNPERRHGHPREVAQSNPERRHGHPREVAQMVPCVDLSDDGCLSTMRASDPDPGSVTINRYGSGSFHQQATKLRKPLISTVL